MQDEYFNTNDKEMVKRKFRICMKSLIKSSKSPLVTKSYIPDGPVWLKSDKTQ